MKNREKICIWLFDKSKTPYAKYFKSNAPWNLNSAALLSFPTNTLGYELGLFLSTNGYQLIPKLEKHDAYHVITEYGTSVKDEIALQYFFLGNKKRSPYLFGVIAIGALLTPENFIHYHQAYLHGKRATPFHKWDIKQLLHQPLNEIRSAVFNSKNTPTTQNLKHSSNTILN